MIEERTIRVWVDDHNAVFRLGLTACLEAPGYALAGQSTGFSPEPELRRADLLVFDLDERSLRPAVELTRGSAVRLIALARSSEDDLLVDAVEAGVSGAIVRSEVSPRAFLHCLRSVADGNGFLPAAALSHLTGAPGPTRRARLTGDLSGRELDVLRLLSNGESTREIASNLCYSEKTVKNIVHDVLVRMNCRNRAQAVALATRRGLI
ncbi:MAG: LuxR C-terminal-related transcriptional regulator [Acidimicrobiia bacterium]